MPFRIATFLAASALGGGLATALLNWHYAWLGAWLGAVLWLLLEREQQTRQAEDRLQEFLAAIQASPNGVVLLDEQGRIEWCNQTAAGQFGIDAERDLLQHMANLVRDPAFVAYLASWNYSRDVVIDAPSTL